MQRIDDILNKIQFTMFNYKLDCIGNKIQDFRSKFTL